MTISIPDLDLKTEEGARKALADIHAAAKALRDQNGELRGDVQRMADDLAKANKTISELQNLALMAPAGAVSEGDLGKYVTGPKESRSGATEIRWTGEVSKVGGQDCYQPGLLDEKSDCEWQTELQRLVEQRTMVRACTKAGTSPSTDRALANHLARAPSALAPTIKVFADSSGVGASFIPDLLSPEFEQEYMLQRRVEALFQAYPMAGKELRIPFVTNGLRPYIKGAVTTDDPAQYTSSSIAEVLRSITATGLAVRTQADEDAMEDSVIAVLPFLRSGVASAIGDGVEDAIINGCTGTHNDTGLAGWNIANRWGDTGLGGSGDHRRAWGGLRALATAASLTTDQAAAETAAGFLTALGKLPSPHGISGNGVNPQTTCIVSPLYYVKKMLGFSEIITVDKAGPKATILTGQLASLFGVAIVPSEFCDNKYNASGIYDNSTKTKGGFLLFNRSRFYMGNRRAQAIEVEKDITRGVFNIVATRRCSFFQLDGATTAKVHWSYNLTATS